MSPEPGEKREYQPLVPVFHGSMGEVMALQASLGAQGFETYVDQELTKTFDPTITGGGDAFNLTLVASADRADEIGAALTEMRSDAAHRAANAPDETDGAADDEKPDEPDAAPEPEANRDVATMKELEDCGRRVRWSAVASITFPIGLVLGVAYVSQTWNRTPKPPKHVQTVMAFALCWVQLALLVLFIGLVTRVITFR